MILKSVFAGHHFVGVACRGEVQIGDRMVNATAFLLAITSLVSTTLSGGLLHTLRPNGVGVEWGGSHVQPVLGEQQRGRRQVVALSPDIQDDCAAREQSEEDTVEAFDNTTALSLGSWVARVLTGKRRAGGEEGTWYKDQLASLLVEYCEEQQRSVHHR